MEDLIKLQSMLTNILKVFHDFCDEHSIMYYAIGGTALGAARHKGFIPWDDDIDVALPRPDYERFISIFNKENTNKRYILETPNSQDPLYPYPYSKIYDTQTTLIENTHHPIKRGLFLDVFPLDGVGNDTGEANRFVKDVLKLSTIRKMIVCVPSKRRGSFVNCFLFLSNTLASVLRLKEAGIRLKIDSKCKEKSYDSCSLVANLLGTKGINEVIPKDYLGKPQKIQFGNISICCPEKIDEYLTRIYGDWKSLPPKENQITHHDFVFDLNKSYLEANV